jgi:hypothetical protein
MMLLPFALCAADDFEDDFDAEKSASKKKNGIKTKATKR